MICPASSASSEVADADRHQSKGGANSQAPEITSEGGGYPPPPVSFPAPYPRLPADLLQRAQQLTARAAGDRLACCEDTCQRIESLVDAWGPDYRSEAEAAADLLWDRHLERCQQIVDRLASDLAHLEAIYTWRLQVEAAIYDWSAPSGGKVYSLIVGQARRFAADPTHSTDSRVERAWKHGRKLLAWASTEAPALHSAAPADSYVPASILAAREWSAAIPLTAEEMRQRFFRQAA